MRHPWRGAAALRPMTPAGSRDRSRSVSRPPSCGSCWPASWSPKRILGARAHRPVAAAAIFVGAVAVALAAPPPSAVAQSTPTPNQAAESSEERIAEARAAEARGDDRAARRLWGELANDGDIEAMWRVARLLQEGRGGDRDASRAFFWLHKAAIAGRPEAQRAVARAYQTGDGVERNAVAAALWHRRLAEVGDAEAQFRLAEMFERGEGVPQDLFTALKWFDRAAAQGHEPALRRLGLLTADEAGGTLTDNDADAPPSRVAAVAPTGRATERNAKGAKRD